MQKYRDEGKLRIHPDEYHGATDTRVLALNILDYHGNLTNPAFPPIPFKNMQRGLEPMDKTGLEFIDHRLQDPHRFEQQPPLWMGSTRAPMGLPKVRDALCQYGATTSVNNRITLASVFEHIPRSDGTFFKYDQLLPRATAKDRLENYRYFPAYTPQLYDQPSDHTMNALGRDLYSDGPRAATSVADGFPSLQGLEEGASTPRRDALDEFTDSLDAGVPDGAEQEVISPRSSSCTAWSKQEVLTSLHGGSWSLSHRVIAKRSRSMGQ